MKKIFALSLATGMLFLLACKTQKGTTKDDAAIGLNTSLIKGTVSHQFRADGCPTVIIVEGESSSEPIILIPKEKLPDKLDKDGLKVQFNYHPLKMPNPLGCAAGFPAEITDIKVYK